MRGWRKLVVSGFELWQPKLPLTWRFGVGCPESILMVVVSGCYKVFKNSVVVCRAFGVVLNEVLARCRCSSSGEHPRTRPARSLSRTGRPGSVP